MTFTFIMLFWMIFILALALAPCLVMAIDRPDLMWQSEAVVCFVALVLYVSVWIGSVSSVAYTFSNQIEADTSVQQNS